MPNTARLLSPFLAGVVTGMTTMLYLRCLAPVITDIGLPLLLSGFGLPPLKP